MPFTVFLPDPLVKELPQTLQTLLAILLNLRKAQALQSNLFVPEFTHSTVLGIELILVFKVIMLCNRDFLTSKRRKPAEDFVVRTACLEIGNQVLNSDSGRG